MYRKPQLSFVCVTLRAGQLMGARGNAQTCLPFVEPDDGRAPLTSALDQATQSIDIYVFILTLAANDEIVNSLRSAVARGVTVRALLDPCPGESATCDPPNPPRHRASLLLTQA